MAKSGTQYTFVDAETGRVPEGLRVVRQGDSLIVEIPGEDQIVRIDEFYADPTVSFVPVSASLGEVFGDLSLGDAITEISPDNVYFGGEPTGTSAGASSAGASSAGAGAGASGAAASAGAAAGGIGLSSVALGAVGVAAAAGVASAAGSGSNSSSGNSDDAAPTFASDESAAPIEENTGAGQVVYVAKATDADGSIAYSLKSGADSAAFTIDPDTGAVTLTSDPDFETQASYSFTVVATDEAGNAAEQTVTLSIGDVDEAGGTPPVFTSGDTAGAIEENQAAGQVVYTANATDAEGDVAYSLKAGGDAAAFAIDPESGVVTLVEAPDYEARSSYSFTVIATDVDGNATKQAVTLAVSDLDEAPAFTSGETAAAIDENSGAGQIVYTAAAVDDGDGTVSYGLKDAGDAAAFTINAQTGEVTLTGDPDFETKAGYDFTVVATDSAGNSAEQAVSLTINDVDEAPPPPPPPPSPSITSGATASAIDENSGASQVIYTAAANGTGSLTYSLKAGGDASAFTIDATTGAVTLTGDPDFEAKASYGFTVVATDDGGRSGEQAVSLGINNLDEVAPTITSGATAAAIDENSGAAQTVYTAVSTDAADVSAGVTYSLKPVDDAAAFSIDGNTGAVTLTGDPDYETDPSYDFTVVATDTAGNATEQAVTLGVNNLDEAAPTITSAAAATAIDENSGSGQAVYTATSTDAADISGGVTYSLKAVDDAAAFSIDGSTGVVTLTGDPDFEIKSSYDFTVVATDAAGNSNEQAVTLAINNLDEVAPTITSAATATAIDENSGAGQTVYTATSTDSGDISSGVTYSLKAVDDAAAFSIDGTTGAVTLTGNPDYETDPSYDFTVVATDAAGNSDEQAVTLAINNLDEVAPDITSAATAAAIDENSGAGQTVYTVTSTDAGDVSGGVTYSIKAVDDASAFSIDASTGAVTLTGDPDYEAKPSYDFTIVATDAANNSSEQAVTLAINDIDDTGPSVNSIALSSAVGDQNNLLNAGDVLSLTVTMDEATLVDLTGGTPRIALNIGGSTVYAGYSSGSGSTALVFDYTIQPGQTDTNGISISANAIDVNGGTLQDAAGNDAVLTHALVSDDASYKVDTTAPTLSSSSPADESASVAVGSNIVLNFDESMQAGSGNIVITDGSDIHTIAATDSQVSIAGNTVTINPTTDLAAGSTYHVEIDSGALTDLAGNDYTGFNDSTTLNFDTAAAVDTSIVVFDLVNGVDSDHSGRTFSAGESYTIYVRVDSDNSQLFTTPQAGAAAGASWGTWNGANNLGADDRIVLVGDGTPVTGNAGSAHLLATGPNFIAWATSVATIGVTTGNLSLYRYGLSTNSAQLAAGGWASNPNAGSTLGAVYLSTMPAGVLVSQGLI